MNNEPTLKTGNYTIKLTSGAAQIYQMDEQGMEHWLAACYDIELATRIVEGLILVDAKRFYHPEAAPTFNTAEGKPLPPFLVGKNKT